MWRIETKDIFIENSAGARLPSVSFALVKDADVRIELVGSSREHGETLYYSDGITEFRFYATRYDLDGKRITDKYKIYVPPNSQQALRKTVKYNPVKQEVAIVKNNIIEALTFYSQSNLGKGQAPVSKFEFVEFIPDS